MARYESDRFRIQQGPLEPNRQPFGNYNPPHDQSIRRETSDRFDRYDVDRSGDVRFDYPSHEFDRREQRGDWNNEGRLGTSFNYRGPHAGKGPKGYQRSDDRIREDVNEHLTANHDVDANDIEVSVAQGEVTLTGFVSDRRQKRMAEDVAESVSGVHDVHNQLRVQSDNTNTAAEPATTRVR